TKGTGHADKVTVFADKLSLPSTMAFANGGVLIINNTQTVFLKSSKGDDKADIRKVVFDGWSQRDSHGGPSNMQYGLDNWIWAMQGYNNSPITINGQTVRVRQGFHRFKPDGS